MCICSILAQCPNRLSTIHTICTAANRDFKINLASSDGKVLDGDRICPGVAYNIAVQHPNKVLGALLPDSVLPALLTSTAGGLANPVNSW